MNKRILLLLALLLAPFLVCAAGLPEFGSDQEADRWFRENSAFYRGMAAAVDAAGGYTVSGTVKWPGGVAYYQNGRGCIELNNSLRGAHRFSILIFELTNLYQERHHREVTDRVRRGELNDAGQFGLLREMIEYDGVRLHQMVLMELKPVLGTVPAEMITWLSTNARSFDDYRLPYAYEYLRAQQASGHTAGYLKLFEKHRAEYLDSLKKAD